MINQKNVWHHVAPCGTVFEKKKLFTQTQILKKIEEKYAASQPHTRLGFFFFRGRGVALGMLRVSSLERLESLEKVQVGSRLCRYFFETPLPGADGFINGSTGFDACLKHAMFFKTFRKP